MGPLTNPIVQLETIDVPRDQQVNISYFIFFLKHIHSKLMVFRACTTSPVHMHASGDPISKSKKCQEVKLLCSIKDLCLLLQKS
jgi:hypothetical protein